MSFSKLFFALFLVSCFTCYLMQFIFGLAI